MFFFLSSCFNTLSLFSQGAAGNRGAEGAAGNDGGQVSETEP